jgi:Protein of unknown function (DUF5663)
MFKLDDNLLQELGLGSLPPGEKNQMLGHIYNTLEMRVGVKLAEQMSNEQLDDFERFIDGDISYAVNYLDEAKPGWKTSPEYQTQVNNAKASAARANVAFNENAVTSEFGALLWLETNFPGYKQVVAEQLDKLKVEIKTVAPQILASSATHAQAGPQPQVQRPMPPQPQAYPQMPGQPAYQYPPQQPMPQAPPGYYQQPMPMPQYQQPMPPQGYYYQQPQPMPPGYQPGQPMYRPVQQPMPPAYPSPQPAPHTPVPPAPPTSTQPDNQS